MRVIFYDPYLPYGAELSVGYDRVHYPRRADGERDIVTIHAPLTAETRGMIGAAAFAAAKPGLVLVNTARGPIVDLDALADALRDGRIAGAGLDVLPPSRRSRPSRCSPPGATASPGSATASW